ncbi:methyltransferase domain-containing protein [Streptomyces maoxianensis]|uniref:Protein-L-isoaspartate O-methyltransferase n=1 Tax=Streptomyces maoxianensis TaxID=1459942 RepID=A0ABV9GHD7_9ACTN
MDTAQLQGYADLVQGLADRGHLDNRWRQVFTTVPRDLFIPEHIWRQAPEACEPITSRAAWLELVHSDEPVVIQIDDGGEDGPGVATSSNSQPSMVAKMLGHLQIEDGHRVLEIGTASGYFAALLTERLGEQNVYSVELDPALAELAESNLHAAGYMPQLRCGDGEEGWPGAAPFDRLIATCALRHIPQAFVEQVRPGGIIVAPIARDFWSGALVQLAVQDDGTASGPFRGGASYMAMRSHRLGAGTPVDSSTARSRKAGPDPAGMLTLGFALYAGARLPGVSMWHSEKPGHVQVWASRRDGSAATAATGEDVWQYGTANLWEEIEQVLLEYSALGSPGTEDFGLTVDSDGQHVWLREPRSRVQPTA